MPTIFDNINMGYKGRNPKTGVEVEVKPKVLPAFKPGKTFAEMVNK